MTFKQVTLCILIDVFKWCLFTPVSQPQISVPCTQTVILLTSLTLLKAWYLRFVRYTWLMSQKIVFLIASWSNKLQIPTEPCSDWYLLILSCIDEKAFSIYDGWLFLLTEIFPRQVRSDTRTVNKAFLTSFYLYFIILKRSFTCLTRHLSLFA